MKKYNTDEERKMARRAITKKSYDKNPKAYQDRTQQWKKDHQEQNQKIGKTWRDKNRESVKVYKKNWYKKNPLGLMIKAARARANKYNLACSITQQDIFIPEVCPILGIPLLRGDGRLTDNSPSLDRIFPEKGYIPENIAVISYRANMIKSNGTADEYRQVADWIDSQLLKGKQ